MQQHQDLLKGLNKDTSLSDKLKLLHEFINQKYDFIDRIAAAVYESNTDLLRTYVDSTHGKSPLHHYEVKLSTVKSLVTLAETGHSRVLNDLSPGLYIVQAREKSGKLIQSMRVLHRD